MRTSTTTAACSRAAQALLPIIEETAAEANRSGAMTESTARELKLSGLTHVFRPLAFQGPTVDLSDYLRAITAIASVGASAAWCLQIYNVSNWLIGSLFDDDVLATIYAGAGDGLITGSMVPNGPCETTLVDGGYRLTGGWRFVSGCDHADWTFIKAPVPTESDPKAHVLVLVPRDACQLADDWQYAGLEGTGSKSIRVEGYFIPEDFAVPFDDHVLECGPAKDLGRTLPHFMLPSRVMMRLPITAVAIGVARRAIQLFETNISEARPSGFSPRSVPSFQGRLAESELEVDLADRLLHATASEAGQRVANGASFPAMVRATQGRDLVHAVSLCTQAVDRLMAVSGARQMFANNPMQQAFRDIHAIACHHSCDRDRMMGSYAKARLGLDLNGEVL